MYGKIVAENIKEASINENYKVIFLKLFCIFILYLFYIIYIKLYFKNYKL